MMRNFYLWLVLLAALPAAAMKFDYPLSYSFGPLQTIYVGNGFNLSTRPGSPARLYFADDHSNGHGYVALGGVSGDVVLNPTTSQGILQLGTTANAGNQIYLQYANDAEIYGTGFSHPLIWRAKSAGGQNHYPGIVGFAPNAANEYGDLRFYTRVPMWNVNNHDPTAPTSAGTEVFRISYDGTISDMNVASRIEIGAGANGNAAQWGLDVSSGANPGVLLGANLSSDARTDGTDKYSYVAMMPRTHSQPKVSVIISSSTSGANTINVGGGTGVNQPATAVNLYAGSAGSASAGSIQVAVQSGSTDVRSARFLISAPTVPSSASDTGTAGTISWDANYIYVCTAANTWKRVAIATW